MAETPFKMKGFSGFGNSPLQAKTSSQNLGFDFKRTPTQDIKFGARHGYTNTGSLNPPKGWSTTAKTAYKIGDIAKKFVKTIPFIGEAKMTYDVLKEGVKRVITKSDKLQLPEAKATKFSGGKTWTQSKADAKKKGSIWKKK